jgi:hypothetical protein
MEAAQEAESDKAVGYMEEEIGEVEAGGVELPDVTIESEGDPVDRAVGDATGSAEVSSECYGCEKEAVREGVPIGEGWIVENLVEVVVDERCAEGIPVESEAPEDRDGDERKILMREAPLKYGWPGGWLWTEYGGTTSGHTLS